MRFYKIISADKIKIANEFLLELEDKAEKNYAQTKTITPFEWDEYLMLDVGFFILPKFLGFKPINKIKAPIGWKYDKIYTTILVCDKKTKVGCKNIKLLDNMANYCFIKIYDILGIKYNILNRFSFPKTVFF